MRVYSGKLKNRVGICIENWMLTPGTSIRRRALPENVSREITKIWGIQIGRYFWGVQRIDRKDDLKGHTGYPYGPHPDMLDIIKDSE